MFSKLKYFNSDNRWHSFIGLENLGNTCYINACVQALAHILPFKQYFADFHFRRLRLQSETTIDELLHRLITAICFKTAVNLNSDKLRSPLHEIRAFISFIWKHHPQFHPGHQHDSMEFLLCLLNDLHETLKVPGYGVSKQQNNPLEKSYQNPELLNLIHPFCFEEFEDGQSYEHLIRKIINLTELIDDGGQTINDNEVMSEDSDNDLQDLKNFFHSKFPEDCPTFTNLKFKSIITDLFAGELENTIVCTNCNSKTENIDTFFNLSVPIVDTDQANKAKINSNSAFQANNKKTTAPSTSRQIMTVERSLNLLIDTLKYYYNYVFSLYGWLMSKLEPKTVDLKDCLDIFFNPEILENDNQYFCNKCQKLCVGLKNIRIKRCPNFLILQLNRYRHVDSIVRKINTQLNFPLNDLQLSSFIKEDNEWRKFSSYDLVAVICHSGTQVTNGHYICYALDRDDFEWFEYDDQNVRYVDSECLQSLASNAYILFYMRKDHEDVNCRILSRICDIERVWFANTNDRYLEASLRLEKNLYFFLSEIDSQYIPKIGDSFVNPNSMIINKYWLNFFTSFQFPGQINNSELICKHNLVRPTECLYFNFLSVPVIKPVGRLLRILYGGGPFLQTEHDNMVCLDCFQQLKQLDIRREQEFEVFINLQGERPSYFRRMKVKKYEISVKICNDNASNQKDSIAQIIPVGNVNDSGNIVKNLDKFDCYIISAEWIIKWLCFVDLKIDQLSNSLNRQMENILHHIKKTKQFEQSTYQELGIKPLRMYGDEFFPPLSSLLTSINNTMKKNNFSIPQDVMLGQIDMDLHTITLPGMIENWSLFGLKRKIKAENDKRVQLNRKNIDSEPLPTLNSVDTDNVTQCQALLFELLCGEKPPNAEKNVDDKDDDYVCRYNFDFTTFKSAQLYDEDRNCSFYVVDQNYWDFFHGVYGGGPTIKINFATKNIQFIIESQELQQFLQANFTSTTTTVVIDDGGMNDDLIENNNSKSEEKDFQEEEDEVKEEATFEEEIKPAFKTVNETNNQLRKRRCKKSKKRSSHVKNHKN